MPLVSENQSSGTANMQLLKPFGMAGTNLNPLQLAIALAALVLLLASFLLPWAPIRALVEERFGMLPAFRALARRRGWAILFIGLLAFAGDAVVSKWKPPLPIAPD